MKLKQKKKKIEIEELLNQMIDKVKESGHIPTKIVLTEEAYNELLDKLKDLKQGISPFSFVADLENPSKGAVVYDPNRKHLPGLCLEEFKGLEVENYGQQVKVEYE